MEKTVQIDGKPVRLLATAALPRRFRAAFGKDFYGELAAIEKSSKAITRESEAAERLDDPNKKAEILDELESRENALNAQSLELIENLAHLMARSADPDNIPANVEDWLDGIQDPLAIADIAQDVLYLYSANAQTTAKPKKKNGRRTAK